MKTKRAKNFLVVSRVSNESLEPFLLDSSCFILELHFWNWWNKPRTYYRTGIIKDNFFSDDNHHKFLRNPIKKISLLGRQLSKIWSSHSIKLSEKHKCQFSHVSWTNFFLWKIKILFLIDFKKRCNNCTIIFQNKIFIACM